MGKMVLLDWTFRMLGVLYRHLRCVGLLPSPRYRSELAREFHESAIHQHPTHDNADCGRQSNPRRLHPRHSHGCVVEPTVDEVEKAGSTRRLRHWVLVSLHLHVQRRIIALTVSTSEAVIFSTLSIVYKVLLNSNGTDYTYWVWSTLLLCLTKMCFGISCACMPATAGFFKRGAGLAVSCRAYPRFWALRVSGVATGKAAAIRRRIRVVFAGGL
jgi:hypothetical protein